MIWLLSYIIIAVVVAICLGVDEALDNNCKIQDNTALALAAIGGAIWPVIMVYLAFCTIVKAYQNACERIAKCIIRRKVNSRGSVD